MCAIDNNVVDCQTDIDSIAAVVAYASEFTTLLRVASTSSVFVERLQIRFRSLCKKKNFFVLKIEFLIFTFVLDCFIWRFSS